MQGSSSQGDPSEDESPEVDTETQIVINETEEQDSSEQPSSADPGQQAVFDKHDARWWEGGQQVKIGETFEPRKLNTPLDKLTRKHSGRRSQTHTKRRGEDTSRQGLRTEQPMIVVFPMPH